MFACCETERPETEPRNMRPVRRELEEEMLTAANNLEFEKAALLRDQIKELKRMMMGGETPDAKSGGTMSYARGKGRKRG